MKEMEYFVEKTSIVREIWGKGDTILMIFAGASAEFALNKAVDWLYFTGRLPADPLGRLFSTVSYARTIVFAEKQLAYKAIDSMALIHSGVEAKRGKKIPAWAYRDVLFMLIDYSIRAFEILERKLSQAEKQEIFGVFNEVGNRMGIEGLPETFEEWIEMREVHLRLDLQYSNYSKDLFLQYRKHLGLVRFRVLLESQKLVLPKRVRNLLGLGRIAWLKPGIWIYNLSRNLNLDQYLKNLILPSRYIQEIRELDRKEVMVNRCPVHRARRRSSIA